MSRPAQLHIDTSALQHNFDQVRKLAPASSVLAVLKANAYGHGAVKIARHLPQADSFGVACLEEALLLREAGIRQPVVVMEGFFDATELDAIVRHQLEIVVHHVEQLEALEKYKTSAPIKVWFKINTGMQRLGFLPQQAERAYQRLRACAAVNPDIRLMTHFASADVREDAAALEQMASFYRLTKDWPGQRSLANSAGIINWPDSHQDWIRPGLILYGISSIKGKTAADFNLKPVMTLSSAIIAIQEVNKGDRVGYGGAWICPQAMRVGIVAMGYADGYPWHINPDTPALLNGRQVPIIGNISMDMLMVDLRAQPYAKIGDPVVLWGAGLPVETIARQARTVPYELICKVMDRVKRI